MSARIAAVILAAGQSRRMGCPKLLLPWGQTTVLGQVITAFATGLAADFEIVVVTGADREQIEALVGRMTAIPVRAVHNLNHRERGMLGSIQAGIRALAPGVEAALIGLGDQPQVREETVQDVCAVYRTTHADLIVPSFQNRRGHPWLVSRPLWDEILQLPATTTPRQFLSAQAGTLHYVDVPDDSILRDLDTPEAYENQRPRV
ncbi:MAG: nucleotidyltransferase family protein [Anaerolineales bacterium]|nr:nucleotidyltransferase family protein [Anaerolineales bacterium]